MNTDSDDEIKLDMLLLDLKEKCDFSLLDKTIDIVRFTSNKNTFYEIFSNIIKCVSTTPLNRLNQEREYINSIPNLNSLYDYIENINVHKENIIYCKIEYQDDVGMTDYINGFIAFKFLDKYYQIEVDVKYDWDSYTDMVADIHFINDCSLNKYNNLLRFVEHNEDNILEILGKEHLFDYNIY